MTKTLAFAVAAFISLGSACRCLATETPIHVFTKADGTNPETSLVPDGRGGFFGTASSGGATGRGTIFHLAPPDGTHPAWTLVTLHSFAQNEGQQPQDIAIGKDGALYGATARGGMSGAGTLFRLAPPATGQTAWQFSLIFTFRNGGKAKGNRPFGRLIVGPDGSLYGMTEAGGDFGYGLIYRLAPPTAGSLDWTQTVLHSFDGTHGAAPFGGLSGDPQATMYGSATFGGADCGPFSGGCGTVFQISAPGQAGGAWAFTQLYAFQDQTDGEQPNPVTLGAHGVLYGTTVEGGGMGSSYHGQVFSLTPPAVAGGHWIKAELHAFAGDVGGHSPESGVTVGPGGALYGNTLLGGLDRGTLFKLTPPNAGGTAWHFAVTHTFRRPRDGAEPINGPPTLVSGILYGVTAAGGDPSCGVGIPYECGGTAYTSSP